MDESLNKKNIVFVATTIERGGAENFLVKLAAYLGQKNKKKVIFIAIQGMPHHKSYLERNNVKVIHYNSDKKTRSLFKMCIVCLKYIQDILKYKPETIIANLQPAELVVAIGSFFYKKSNNKLVRHNDEYGWGNKTIRKLVASRFNSYGAISSKCANKIQTEIKKQKKIHILYYGISTDCNLKTTNPFKIEKSDDVINVGLLARLEPQKNHLFLFNSIKNINKKCQMNGKKVIFHLAGSGSLSETLLNAVGELGIDGEVVFYGRIKEIDSFISKCDVTLLVSLYEGLGLVGLESLRCNKPFIAPKIEPFIELYHDDIRNGVYLYNDLDSNSLTEAILESIQFDSIELPSKFIENNALKIWSSFCFEKN